MASDGHGGKISGKLKDSLPVIPDKVVDAIQRGKDVPLEAMISPAAFDAHMTAQEQRKQPIHAEDLVPVSARDPRIAGRTTFDGSSLPAVPSTRRVIPAPFRRPRLEIGQHGRTWQRMRADLVRDGDTVVDVGLVEKIGLINKYQPREEITGQHTGNPEVDRQAVAVGYYVGIWAKSGTWHRFDVDYILRVHAEPREGAEPDNAKPRLV